MSIEAQVHVDPEPTSRAFERVTCGIDGTPESFECMSHAMAVAGPEAAVAAVAVVDRGLALHAGIHADAVERDLSESAERALRRVRAAYPRVTASILRGAEASGFLDAARDAGSDLVAVGSHDSSRAMGIALGSVATSVIHRAPCSVLVARAQTAIPFPDAILIATDGSDDAGQAVAAAARIAYRYGSRVALLQVGDPQGGRSVAEDAMRVIEVAGAEPWIEVRRGSPTREIERFASECGASLLVVGSRGLSGVRALGSVSERVAHRAPCSVLIVRGEPGTHASEAPR